MTEFASTTQPKETLPEQIDRHNRAQALIACDLLVADTSLRGLPRDLVFTAISYFGLAGLSYQRSFAQAANAMRERLSQEDWSPRRERMTSFAEEKFSAIMKASYLLTEAERNASVTP